MGYSNRNELYVYNSRTVALTDSSMDEYCYFVHCLVGIKIRMSYEID